MGGDKIQDLEMFWSLGGYGWEWEGKDTYKLGGCCR